LGRPAPASRSDREELEFQRGQWRGGRGGRGRSGRQGRGGPKGGAGSVGGERGQGGGYGAMLYEPDADTILVGREGESLGVRKLERVTAEGVRLRDSSGVRSLTLHADRTAEAAP